MITDLRREVYLGDGLYASFDGYQIALRAPRIDGNSEVFLEPSVVNAFLAYVQQLNASRSCGEQS